MKALLVRFIRDYSPLTLFFERRPLGGAMEGRGGHAFLRKFIKHPTPHRDIDYFILHNYFIVFNVFDLFHSLVNSAFF